MNNNKKINIVIIVVTIILFSCSIFFVYINDFRKSEENYIEINFNLLNYRNEQDNNYILNENIQINKSENNIHIQVQDILKNIDNNIIGFKYSLDGINYTSTILLNEEYIFEYVKNIDDISSIYIKIIDKKYNDILTCQYAVEGFKYIPNLDMQVSTKDYTNDSVCIVLSSNNILDDNYKIYYKINNAGYIEYTSDLEIKENNTKVTAMLYNEKEDKVEKQLDYTVTNIDKISPTLPNKLDIYIKDNILYIKPVDCVDNESGILGFKYKINDNDLSDFVYLDNYYMYEIKNEEKINISVTAYDNVLNESNTYNVSYDLNEIKNN